MKPILFLDVDGVFTSFRAQVGSTAQFGQLWECFDPLAVRFFNKWEGWEIVVSSSWRLASSRNVDAHMYKEGLCLPIIGHTPQITANERIPRCKEIESWLDSNAPHQKHHLLYCIVDDESDAQLHENRFVRTDGQEGMLNKHYEQALVIKNDVEQQLLNLQGHY